MLMRAEAALFAHPTVHRGAPGHRAAVCHPRPRVSGRGACVEGRGVDSSEESIEASWSRDRDCDNHRRSNLAVRLYNLSNGRKIKGKVVRLLGSPHK